ncbi:hypothetical protein HYN48_07350 [Flavobacterium magnum]|uniref:Uncharacterized protein n=1 Tax=Flavobacterium magnum TaxID=2162713 RepID=A0A2S0REG3_9FLAO|nr:hypothetical protein HYN48_07350 [Flavobacterium magnum]
MIKKFRINNGTKEYRYGADFQIAGSAAFGTVPLLSVCVQNVPLLQHNQNNTLTVLQVYMLIYCQYVI